MLPPFVASRLLLFVCAGLGLLWSPVQVHPGQWQAFPQCPWLDGWARWDSGWYWTVVAEGYRFHPGVECNANFYPLFPWVAGLCSLPLRGFLPPPQAFYLAGMGVANLGFLVGLWGLARLGKALVGQGATRPALWLICLHPFSFYFSAAYAEGLYFGLMTWAFVMARREHWHAACLLVAATMFTRPHGFVLASVMAVLYAQSRRFDWRRCDGQALALLWLPVAGLALHGVWWAATGEPLAWEKASRVWRAGSGIHRVLCQLWDFGSEATWLAFFTDLCVITLFLWGASTRAVYRRLGPALAWFVVASLGLSASFNLDGLARYACPVFPPYLVWGAWFASRPRSLVAVLAACALLLLACSFQFTHWRPA